MGGLDKAKDSVEPKDTKSLPPAWLMEKLAAIEHERWADWQKWCHKVLWENIPSDVMQDYVYPILKRWELQAGTTYKALSEQEKQSDREQVLRYWPLLQEWANDLASNNPEASAELSNPPKDMNTSKSLDDLVQKLGDICHEHYLGCAGNKTAPDGYEYSYDNEVINLLDSPEGRAAIVEAVEGLFDAEFFKTVTVEPHEKLNEAWARKARQAIKEWQEPGGLVEDSDEK